MLLEIDEVFVNRQLWQRVLAGDEAARDELRKELDGLVLYLHALSVSGDDGVVVTLRELQAQHCVGHVTLSKDP